MCVDVFDVRVRQYTVTFLDLKVRQTLISYNSIKSIRGDVHVYILFILVDII